MPSLAIPSKISRLDPIFPLEIFDNIIALAEKSQLPTTLRVSRAFHQSSSYQRYRSVLLIGLVWNEVTRPLPTKGPIPEYIVDDTLAIGFDEPATFLFDWLCAIPTLPSSPTLPHPFLYVTRLFLQAHREPECEGVPPLDMPHIHTLQILPKCNRMEYHDYLELCCHEDCPLLRDLRPRQILTGDSETGLFGDGRGLWMSAWRILPEWVEELVLFVGAYSSMYHYDYCVPAKCDLPSTLRRITFVFQPHEGAPKWIVEPYIDGGCGLCHPLPREGEERLYLWEHLALSSKGESGLEVEIVGMELIDEKWLGVSVETGMEELREAMVDLDMKAGMEQCEAEMKAGRVQFYDKDIWAEREGERDFKRVVG